MNRRLVLTIGLILLAGGISITVLTLTRILPNSQHYSVAYASGSDSNPLTSAQFQSKEYVVFEEIFDAGDKMHLNFKADAPAPEGFFENGPYRVVRYILDIYVKDDANTTFLQKELDTRSANYPSGNEYSIEAWLQIPIYNRYKVLVVYKPWMEMGSATSWHIVDYSMPIEEYLKADLGVEKEAISPVFLTLGLVILVAGTALIAWPLVRRSRGDEKAVS